MLCILYVLYKYVLYIYHIYIQIYIKHIIYNLWDSYYMILYVIMVFYNGNKWLKKKLIFPRDDLNG